MAFTIMSKSLLAIWINERRVKILYLIGSSISYRPAMITSGL